MTGTAYLEPFHGPSMIIHPECYDSSRPDYQDLIKDVCAAASGSTAYRRLGAKGSYLTLVRVADRIL